MVNHIGHEAVPIEMPWWWLPATKDWDAVMVAPSNKRRHAVMVAPSNKRLRCRDGGSQQQKIEMPWWWLPATKDWDAVMVAPSNRRLRCRDGASPQVQWWCFTLRRHGREHSPHLRCEICPFPSGQINQNTTRPYLPWVHGICCWIFRDSDRQNIVILKVEPLAVYIML